MKKITVLIILWVTILFTSCTAEGGDFSAPKLTRLSSQYKMITLNAYNMILGFSPDAQTIVALKDETSQKGEKRLIFIDTSTAKETGDVTVDPMWQIEQKRIRWSRDGLAFVLSDAWNNSVETRSQLQVVGYETSLPDQSALSFGQAHLEDQGKVICSPSYDSLGENITYSVYDYNTDSTSHYIKAKQSGTDRFILSETKGVASLLELTDTKYLESVEDKTEGTDTVLFVKGDLRTNIIHVRDAQRSVYIKDYCTNRRRILMFETSLVTEGTQIAREKIIPHIVEFDEQYENFTIKEVDLQKKYDVLNGIMSPDGRYAVFIVYYNQEFIMALYDINNSKYYELLDNKEIGSTFMGTMPGRVDGLFMSEDRKICLSADNGIFIFNLE